MRPDKTNQMITGRGATAIYLALNQCCQGQEVIVPSNVCYAAVLPILFSNKRPHFVDIEYPSGNMTFEAIESNINKDTGAIIYPHMYGNVSSAIIPIRRLCDEKGILLIEDCASAMGGKIEGKPVGNFGHCAIFSTGHAKNIDLGNGGYLFSDWSIKAMADSYKAMTVFDEEIAAKQAVFSKQYGMLRRSGNEAALRELFSNLSELRDLFLYRLEDRKLIGRIAESFTTIERETLRRQEKYNLFKNNLPSEIVYQYNEGSAPWRFSILINDADVREAVISRLLAANLFVSDWYPCIPPSFGDKKSYPNAERMEREILNFSLQESDEEVLRTCDIIKSVLRGYK